jgi:hypothetical protein
VKPRCRSSRMAVKKAVTMQLLAIFSLTLRRRRKSRSRSAIRRNSFCRRTHKKWFV